MVEKIRVNGKRITLYTGIVKGDDGQVYKLPERIIAMKTVDFTGTVSSATMRSQDVLPAIMAILEEYHPVVFHRLQFDIVAIDDKWAGLYTVEQTNNAYSAICSNDDHPAWDSEEMSCIINEDCWDAMQDIAPEGHYFGAHSGDGCDYGFWAIDEGHSNDYS